LLEIEESEGIKIHFIFVAVEVFSQFNIFLNTVLKRQCTHICYLCVYDKKTHSFHALNIQTINVMTVLCKTLLEGKAVQCTLRSCKHKSFYYLYDWRKVSYNKLYSTVPVLKNWELHRLSIFFLLFKNTIFKPFHCQLCLFAFITW
jgi:hypothetical protein